MSAIHLSATAGPDGVLHLDIPVGGAGEFEVRVTYSPKATALGSGRKPTPEELGWSADFLKNVLGSIDDDSFVRQPQGEFEAREPLE